MEHQVTLNIPDAVYRRARQIAKKQGGKTEAGLRRPRTFRSFLVTLPQSKVLAAIGSLSFPDWQKVQACIRKAIAV